MLQLRRFSGSSQQGRQARSHHLAASWTMWQARLHACTFQGRLHPPIAQLPPAAPPPPPPAHPHPTHLLDVVDHDVLHLRQLALHAAQRICRGVIGKEVHALRQHGAEVCIELVSHRLQKEGRGASVIWRCPVPSACSGCAWCTALTAQSRIIPVDVHAWTLIHLSMG
jgi:hypothetical protein